MTPTRSTALWERGFRPFFVLCGTQAVLALGAWLAVIRGGAVPPHWPSPFHWHGHEMLFGFGSAAMAGFLLTAVPGWTQRPALTGRGLAALAALWVVGRISIATSKLFPSPWIPALVDVAFLVAFGIWIGKAIYGARSQRNYAFPLLIGLFALASLLTHLEVVGPVPGAAAYGERLGLGCLLVVLTILGGRLVPLFTRNAMKRAGIAANIRSTPWAEATAAPLLAAWVVADLFFPHLAATGAVALLCAATLVIRTLGWGFTHTLRDPLLWSMHVAYLWVPAGLAVLGASVLGVDIPRGIGIHALTVGAVGGMILAIMTRVALGHTGRPFRAPPGMALAYGLVNLAALLRTVVFFTFPSWGAELLLGAGLAWCAAFALYLLRYTPYLIAPRIDVG